MNSFLLSAQSQQEISSLDNKVIDTVLLEQCRNIFLCFVEGKVFGDFSEIWRIFNFLENNLEFGIL